MKCKKKWQEDSDKLTFIILDKQTFESNGGDDEIGSMAGDVNAFICQQNEEEEPTTFEISVMVAEQKYRNKGIAKEACLLIINYIFKRINSASNFIAKISLNNKSSICLFKKLGFKEESFSDVFQLFTFKLKNCEAKKD
uniref:N-acetyltransferase domain-containing protein n=1 Tax=Meloidogyne enterolobii TaxID=390850 RepID=A0A6V7UHQ3_MELEN|nr:unnamed protein product [Meloidogyne enterolobii]